MDLLYAFIILLFFGTVILSGIRKDKLQEDGDLLGRYNRLRGLFAFEIIIGHCVQGEHSYLFLFENFLCLSVAFFFFVSAYGMTLSYTNKQGYLRGFVYSKCGYIFIANTIAFFCGAGLSFVTGYTTKFTSKGDIVSTYFESTNWFIWEIMAFYVLFYIVFKTIKHNRWIMCLVVVTVSTFLMYMLGVFESYYTASFAFPLGIFIGEKDDLIKKLLNVEGMKCAIVSVLLIVAGLGCFLIPGGNIYRDLYLRNIMAAGIILFIGVLLFNISCGNRFMDFLSRYSAGLYFYQFIFLELCIAMGIRYYVKIPIVILGAFTMSLILDGPTKKINKMLKSGTVRKL